jgi:MFS family permease
VTTPALVHTMRSMAPRGVAARSVVLVVMTLANAMILVDQTAVPLALPDIMLSFDEGSAAVQWVLTTSLLPLAALLVFGGRLGDLVGLRRVFIAGAALFSTASAIGGLAPDLPLLLAARVAQGVGGALMLPTSVAIVSAVFPPRRADARSGRWAAPRRSPARSARRSAAG